MVSATDQRGAAMAEMLIALPAVLLMFFAVAQSSLLSVAHLVVRHAAQRAARTAIVVLEDDPARYDGQARGEIRAIAPPPSRVSEALSIRDQTNGSIQQMTRALIERDASRLNAIRAAAYLPLITVAPSMWMVGRSTSLKGVLDRSPGGHLLSGLLYNFVGTAITFPNGPKSDKRRLAPYGPSDEVTVRVTYLFACEVPFAAALMCDQLGELLLGVAYDDARDAARRRGGVFGGLLNGARSQIRINDQNQAMADLREVEVPAAHALMALQEGRYTTIVAEATLPIAGARYYPRSP